MHKPKKGIMFILDGLGDRPTEILKGKTPLEAAETPHMDKLLTKGLGGMVDPLIPGVPVDTHTGTAVLMGVSAHDASQITRGPVEAAGVEMDLEPGDIAFRCNFATLKQKKNGFRIIDRRAGRPDQADADELSKILHDIDVGEGITASVRSATQHRAVLRLSGPNLSAEVSDTDPMYSNGSNVFTAESRKMNDLRAWRTAEAVNLFIHIAHLRLSQHPLNKRRKKAGKLEANGLITRGAGMVCELDNLLHFLAIKTAVVAGESTIGGLSRLLGHSFFSHKHFTALPDTHVKEKIHTAIKALADHDMVYVHFKAPDICAHDLDPVGKMKFIERFDRALSTLKLDDLVMAVTADHSTDSNCGEHCGDPVPSLLYAPSCRQDDCKIFEERDCGRGGLGRINANAFLASMLDYMGRMHNYRPEDSKYYCI